MNDLNATSLLVILSLSQTIPKYLFSVGGPILILVGTINSLFNVLVLEQKKLRKNPCSRCFVAFNIASFFLLYLSFLPTILQIGYNIEPGTYNLPYCRIRVYLNFLLATLPPFYLILASIDRTLVTSASAQVRKWSNRSTIRKCLFGITVFWVLFHIHALIYTDIIQVTNNTFVCFPKLGIYSVMVSYYTFVVHGVIPFVSLSIFAALTIRNLHHRPHHHVDASGVGTIHPSHRQDKQLIRMLFIEILTCVIFNFVFPGVFLYIEATQYQIKSYERDVVEHLLLSISIFIFYVPSCTSLYTNLVVSKSFRKRTKHIILRKLFNNRIRPD